MNFITKYKLIILLCVYGIVARIALFVAKSDAKNKLKLHTIYIENPNQIFRFGLFFRIV